MDTGEGESTQHFRDYLFDLATSRINLEAHGTPTASQLDESGDDDTDGAGDADAAAPDDEPEVVLSRARPVLIITRVSNRGDHVVIDYLYGRQLGRRAWPLAMPSVHRNNGRRHVHRHRETPRAERRRCRRRSGPPGLVRF
jgi:hypothetical protein